MKLHKTWPPKQQEEQKGNRGDGGGGSVTHLGKRAIRRGERVVEADENFPWC